jgi:transglutaminase-like putative cysteine protease
MKKLSKYPAAFIFLMVFSGNIYSQNKLPFGDIKIDDLRNLTYKPDPGADAVVLSDIGVAAFGYDRENFFIEFVRDVKIRIVNSKGFKYANVELAFSPDDDLMSYKASTFNLKNGEKSEVAIGKKSFYKDYSSFRHTLRFTFPEVHEGSVIEYSYTVRLNSNSIYRLVPWKFQTAIPVVSSTITVAYPEYFLYKSMINGSSQLVTSATSTKNVSFLGRNVIMHTISWFTSNMPAFVPEPFIKSRDESLTGITFELSRVDLPGFTQEVTPSYQTLTTKLMERDDFGKALARSSFLKKKVQEITVGAVSDIDKVRKIHRYIAENFTWNGVEDYTASGPLSKVFRTKRGNSADINMLLISAFRLAGLRAEPVILSTRSNGSINQYSAIMQQFNYLIARVNAGGDLYLVDATDPDRPFNVLPFECLNGSGRIIDNYVSEFVDLSNKEKEDTKITADLVLDEKGSLKGNVVCRYSSLSAADLRKSIRLQGEEGYIEELRNGSSEIDITDLDFHNIAARDSDIVQTMQVKLENACQLAAEKYLFGPFLSLFSSENPFSQEKRLFPLDFGSPIKKLAVINVKIPDGYSIVELPADITYNLGKSDGKFEFSCSKKGNVLQIISSVTLDKFAFSASQYPAILDFYSMIIKKESELIVFRKNS